MNENGKTNMTVWVGLTTARLLQKMSEDHRKAEKSHVKGLEEKSMERRAARIEGAALRAERWPTIETVVADCIRARLAEPDLCGPWHALTNTEAARLALSGRWPGPMVPGVLTERNYSLPTTLAVGLRTASWRVSEQALDLLERRGLVGAGPGLSGARLAERNELAAILHSPGRIVRQALDRYGPVAATEAEADTAAQGGS